MDHSKRSQAFRPKHVARGPAPAAHTDRMDAVLKVLRKGRRFLVCSHARPDGDAVGSMLAMGMFIEQMGKHADLVMADQIPKVYCGLPGAKEIRITQIVDGSYDAVILLECDGLARTGVSGLEKLFQINIDHHASGHEYAKLNWIDRDATSVGELVHRLVKAAGARITPEMAHCLYTTILTDTGGFCYGAMQAATFGLAQELVLAGADPVQIAQDVYFSTPASRLLLLGTALTNLSREGRLAWLWVTDQDVLRTSANDEDCEGIVNFALCVSGVEAAVFLRELPERRIRIGLRSKGQVNVAAIAERMGGGGHESAAGCTLEGPLNRALDEILTELRSCVAALGGEES